MMKTFILLVVISAVCGFGSYYPTMSPEQTCRATDVTNKMYEDVFVGGLRILYNISTQGANDKSCLFLVYDRKIESGDISNVTLLYNLDGTYIKRTAVVILSNGNGPLIDFYRDDGELRKLSGEVTSDGVVTLIDCREEGNDILIACKLANCCPEVYYHAQKVAEHILGSSQVNGALVDQTGCINTPQ